MNGELHSTGHRKVIQLSLIQLCPWSPFWTCHITLFLFRFQVIKSRLQLTGWVGKAWLHLGLPASQGHEPSPPGSSSENLCHHPASTSALDSDSEQRLSFPSRTACAFSDVHCFSTMFCNPFSLRHTHTLSEPPSPLHPSPWYRKTRILRRLFCSPPSVSPEWVMSFKKKTLLKQLKNFWLNDEF